MRVNELAAALGKGLFAGLAGTAAMTISTAVEIELTGRGASDAPSKAAGKVLGVQPRNAEGRKRFSNFVHWSYGMAWGAPRGMLSAARVLEPAASVLHFLLVWGTAQVMLPVLNVSPPAAEQDLEQIATDALHHAVYAAATGAAYSYLDNR